MAVDIPPAYENTGIRRIILPDGTQMPGTLAIELPEGMTATTEAETATRIRRTKLAFSGFGIEPDGGTPAGVFIGYAAGGWVTARSDAFGFRVRNADGSAYIFTVDNPSDTITARGALQNVNGLVGAAMILMGDTSSPLASLGSSAVAFQSVAGALKVTQFAAPTVTGSRGGNAALAALLTVLEDAGLVIDATS